METHKIKTIQLIAVALVVAGIFMRLVPHVPNFTPVGAIALFAGAIFSQRLALLLPVAVLLASDLFIGFYPDIMFTWVGFALVAAFGRYFKDASMVTRVSIGGVGGSLLFFVVSNTGVWLIGGGMYPHTLAGLFQCFVMALPFLWPLLLSTIFYSAALFGAQELATRAILRSQPETVSS